MATGRGGQVHGGGTGVTHSPWTFSAHLATLRGVGQTPESSDELSRFGARLRQLRKHAGLSQEELGQRSGLDRTYVSSVERGRRNVGLKNVHALASAMGVPVVALFSEDESATTESATEG
jgi:DNA-binding XRE family transcriptional regulator